MPPQYEMRIQTLKKAQYLKKLGWNPIIISGSYLHNTQINLSTGEKKFIFQEYDGIKFIHIKNLSYGKSFLKRIVSTAIFYLRFYFNSKSFPKPGFISILATVPFGGFTYFIARKLNAKFIVEVVDLWPESLIALKLISKRNPLAIIAFKIEKWIYTKADKLVFSMEGGKDYLKTKGWLNTSGGEIEASKVHYINNGVDLKEFNQNKSEFILPDKDLVDNEYFKVVYIGSIRKANNIKLLIEAAEELKDSKKIKFLIFGDGDDRKRLEDYCIKRGLNNIKFKNKSLPIEYIPYILSQSSLNILNYQPSSILQYGGSQSKSFQYMASGKPICANVKMGYCPVTKYKLGVAREFKSSLDYANTIESFSKLPAEAYNSMCQNSQKAAENYDYFKLTKKFESIILSIQ